MVGNSLFGDILDSIFNIKRTQKVALWDSLSDEKQNWYNGLVEKYNTNKKKENFDPSKWVSGFKDMDKSANDYFTSLNGGIATQNDLIQAMSQTYVEVEKTGSIFDRVKQSFSNFGTSAKNTLKNVGRSLLGGLANAGINMAVSAILNFAITALDDWIHAEEKAIEAGKKAQESISEITDTYKSHAKVVDQAKESYADLYAGINKTTNENVSLSDEEYQNFLDISNQLAESFPTLVSGYDSAGNAMLNLGSNAASVTSQLEALLEVQRQMSHIEMLDKADEVSAGIKASVDKNKRERDNIEKQLKSEEQKLQSLSEVFTTDGNMGLIGDQYSIGSKFYEGLQEAIKKTGAMVQASAPEFLPDGTTRTSYSFLGSDEQIAAAKQAAQQYMNSYSSGIQQGINELKQKLSAKDADLDALWQEYLPSISSLLQTDDTFVQLPNQIQSALLSNIGNVDLSGVGQKYDYDIEKFIQSEWIDPISELSPEATKAIENLFEIDPSTLSLNAYRKEIAKQLNSISDDVKVQQSWSDKLGLDKTMSDIEQKAQTLKERFRTHITEINAMTGNEREIAYNLVVNDGFSGTFDELMKRINLAKTEIDLEDSTLYNEVETAMQSENRGDKYKKMVENLKTAKDLYDKGEIGTDDFKSVAKWLSPSGADDAMNFQENWGKAKRYFTEDSAKGVHNFLKDLESKKLAESTKAVDANGNAIEKWSYKISDLEEAAQKLGIGFEPMMEMFGRLEDYGFSNNFVGSLEQGKQRITDKTKELAEAEAHLAELEREGIQKNGKFGNQTAIDAQKDKIAQLKRDIIETTDAMKQLVEHSAQDYEAQVEGAKSAISTLQKERQKILNDTSMDKFTRESVAAMMQDQIDAWAEEYHIELDADVKPEVDSADLDPVELTIYVSEKDIEKATTAVEKLQDLDITEYSFDFKANTDNIEAEISKAKSMLKKFQNEDGTINMDLEGADEAKLVLETLIARKQELAQPTIMYVDTSQMDSSMATAIGKLQEYQSARQELQTALQMNDLGFDVDVSGAEAKVQELFKQLNSLSDDQKEILVSLGIDTSSLTNLNASIDNVNAEKLVEAKVIGEDQVDTLKNKISGLKDKTVQVNAKVLGSTAVEQLASRIRSLKDKTVTITTVKKETTSADGVLGGFNGTVHAYSKGTAISAYARGTQVGLRNDELALVNELGTESYVSPDGIWRLLPGGAHFEKFKKGSIIFNHLQTKELINKGYVTSNGGHGIVAHATGTAIKAFAGGAGGGSFGYGGSGKKSGVNTSSKKSTTNNTKSTDKNTTATNKNTEATENLQDWIEYSTNLQSKENDRLYNAIESFEMHANQNKAIDAYITDSQAYMNTLRNAQNAYMSKANSLRLDAGYIHKIWAGDDISFEDIQDENLRDKISKYQDYYSKAKELGDQMTELNQKIRETKISKLDNIKDDYDNLVSYAKGIIDYNEAVNDLFESRNLVGNQDALMNNINQQMAIRQALVNEEKELTDQLNALVASGDIAEWTDIWLKWRTEINGVTASIVEADSALEELKQSIMEIRYKSFEDSLNNLDFNSEMFSSIRDLMSQEGIYDDDIKLTDSGKTQLALMEQELISAKQKVANYNTAIEALAKDLAYGYITQAQFNEKLQGYQKDQMSAIKATKEARDAILDLVKDGITKESEAVQELIQKRKDDLSLQKEYYDFQKKMNDKSKEMNKIRAQIAAMEGDNSLETVAKRKKLMSQLQELEEEYNEELNDRKYDIVQDAYDKTNELTKENEEKSLKELETNLNVQNEAIANALEVTKATYATVYEQLNMLAQQYNFTLTDSLTSPWLNAQSAIDAYQQAIGKVQSNVSIDTSQIQGTTPSQNQTVPTKNEASTQNLDKSANGTWLKQGNQWWYQHADSGWTNNGWEQIDGKWYKFDQNGWMQSGWQPWGTDSTGQTAWYYMGDPNDGSMKTSTWVQGKGGKQYFVDHSGVMARNGYVKSVNSGLYYWVNGDGVWEPQWNTYNPNLSKYKLYYNSGKKRVPYDTMAYIDDTKDHKLNLGSEAIITDKGALVQMNAGTTVFSEAQKDFLYEFSKGQIPVGARSMLPSVNTNFASLQPRNAGNVINNIHYDTLMTVKGNVTNEQFMEDICKKAFDYGNKEYKKYYNRLR